MPIQAGVWDDETEIALPTIPFGWIAFTLLTPLICFPIAVALGWAELATTGVSASAALGKTILYGVGLHALLVWPLCGFVFPQYASRWTSFERVSACLALLSPPLVSFLYYQAGPGLTDVWDLTLTVVPAVALGALLYERSGRPWVVSLAVALSSALPWLWLGDRLGGFSPVFSYGVLQMEFQALRAAVAGLSVVSLATVLGRKKAGKALCALGVLHLVTGLVLPILGAVFGKEIEALDPHWPLVLYPFVALAFLRPGLLTARTLAGLLFAGALAEGGELVWLASRLGSGVWSHVHWALAWVSFGAWACLARAHSRCTSWW